MRIALGAAVVVSAGAVWTLAFLGLDGWPLLMFVGGTLVVIVATTLDELEARTPPISDEATTDGPPWRVQLARQIAAANGLIAKGYMEPDDDFEIGTRERQTQPSHDERTRLAETLNATNVARFCEASPGTLLFVGFSIAVVDCGGRAPVEVVRRFQYRPGRIWNGERNPESGAWCVLLDANGRTMHPCMNFDDL